MLLDPNKKDQCINEIESRFSDLIREANLSLSRESFGELLEIVKDSVKFKYFPSYTDIIAQKVALGIIAGVLAPVILVFLPFSILLYPAFIDSLPLITISDDCKNNELLGLSRRQLDILEDIIAMHILSNYPDVETKAKIQKDIEAGTLHFKSHKKRVMAEIERMREEKQLERAQLRMVQLKTNGVAPNIGTVMPIPVPKPVTYCFSSMLRFLAEDHDGNPVIEIGRVNRCCKQ